MGALWTMAVLLSASEGKSAQFTEHRRMQTHPAERYKPSCSRVFLLPGKVHLLVSGTRAKHGSGDSTVVGTPDS